MSSKELYYENAFYFVLLLLGFSLTANIVFFKANTEYKQDLRTKTHELCKIYKYDCVIGYGTGKSKAPYCEVVTTDKLR